MAISAQDFKDSLEGKQLPGGKVTLEPYEVYIGETAMRATPNEGGISHPVWILVAAMRSMGVSIAELCALAAMEDGDTLMAGNSRVTQAQPILVGTEYTARCHIDEVTSRVTRSGRRMDTINVTVTLIEASCGESAGEVVNTFLFMRGGN